MPNRFSFVFILFLLLLSCAFAQFQMSNPNSELEIGMPKFRLAPETIFSDHPEMSRVLIAIRVPYNVFQYVKHDSTYKAVFEVSAELSKTERKHRKEPGVVVAWMDSIVVHTFAKSISRTDFFYTKRTVDVEPGKYKLFVKVTDNDTRLNWEETADITLFKRSGDSLAVTTPVIARWIDKPIQPTDFIPSTTDLLYPGQDTAWVYLQMVPVGTGTTRIHEKIIKEKGEAVLDTMIFLDADHRAFTMAYPIPVANLSSGTYDHQFIFEQAGQRVVRNVKYRIGILGLPAQVFELEKAIKQLKYVLPEKSVDSLLKFEGDKREQAFRNYWAQRDPSPNTVTNEKMQEYYRRVDAANARFSRSREGWDTDRGMVYILFGEPTDVESHPFVTQGRPYEIWYYSKSNQHFTFVDQDGFGEYRLITPLWE